MATTTPNFGWPVPTSTDLVKDGAVAIEGLGDAIDASLLDLKGGTTGQVLSKATNTDMDFTWVAQDDSNAIQNAIVDAKGDIIAATANDTPARLAVGANNTVLTADSSTATGLKWAAPASSGSMTLISTTAITAVSSITLSSIPQTYRNLYILVEALNEVSGTNQRLRCNGVTGGSYRFFLTRSDTTTAIVDNAATSFAMTFSGNPNTTINCTIFNYASTATNKAITSNYSGVYSAASSNGGFIDNTAVTNVTILFGGTPTAGGNIYLYGVN
jgi:hypothetical protein